MGNIAHRTDFPLFHIHRQRHATGARLCCSSLLIGLAGYDRFGTVKNALADQALGWSFEDAGADKGSGNG